MAFDGAFLHCVCSEISLAENSHIDKIHQPSRDELVLVLRKKGFAEKLLISAKSGMARICFTENPPENPETPPMFCMLCRKYFSAARFVGVSLLGLERIAELLFEGTNEMGDRINIKIVCEFLSGAGNIVLVGEGNRIIDAVHRSDIEKSSRIIAPGAVYTYPDGLGKLNIMSTETDAVIERIKTVGGPLPSALLASLEGMSPLVCREIAHRTVGDTDVGDISDFSCLSAELDRIRNEISNGGTPTLLREKNGTPKDFSFTDILQYGDYYIKESYNSFGGLLDVFYKERERIARVNRAGGDLIKHIKNLTARVEKRMNLRVKELSKTADREKYRIYGELIKANIYAIAPGSSEALLPNFYDEHCAPLSVPLDPALSPQKNAQKYFKEYKKSYNAEQQLSALIESDKKELDYLESVGESMGRAATLSDIAEIREELLESGYLRLQSNKRRQKKQKPMPLSFESKEGYKILVGKNNIQNDYITTCVASKNDMWFHTKNIHGAHVVVLSGGNELSDETVIFAATLAAKNSKAKDSSNVPVDYTPVKYVKKPSGAKAGMVIYSANKTVYVTPGGEAV